jgi:hypothetical protein
MLNESKWNFVAPCGLYCRECTAFLDGKCGGCRSDEGLSREYRKYCKIYQCLNVKNLRTCLECMEFPCGFFDLFKAETLKSSSWFLDAWVNMKQIQTHGISSFFGL